MATSLGILFIYDFIDLEGRVSFAYVPVRDQNLVVRGKNWRLICLVFFISFEKKFKKWKKSQGGKWVFVCVFYVKRKWLKYD